MIFIQIKPEFSPINLVLQTREEAEALWDIVETALRNRDREGPTLSPKAKEMAISISDDFTKMQVRL